MYMMATRVPGGALKAWSGIDVTRRGDGTPQLIYSNGREREAEEEEEADKDENASEQSGTDKRGMNLI